MNVNKLQSKYVTIFLITMRDIEKAKTSAEG